MHPFYHLIPAYQANYIFDDILYSYHAELFVVIMQ